MTPGFLCHRLRTSAEAIGAIEAVKVAIEAAIEGRTSSSLFLPLVERIQKKRGLGIMSFIPGAPMETPALYLTPQLEKRRDGLAPKFFDLNKQVEINSKTDLTKAYRTSSKYLNSDGNVEHELQRIIDSITDMLRTLVDPAGKKDLVKMTFEPKGCTWTLGFNPNLRAEAFQILIVCSCCPEDSQNVAFVVETNLVPKFDTVQGSNDPGFKEGKASFDFLALQVRKAVVMCEFPDFPEGCKGRPFRDIYQLNARVSATV